MSEPLVRRAWQVLRREGVRSFWFRFIGECGYRRLFLLSRSLGEPLPALRVSLPLAMDWLAPDEVPEYLALRPTASAGSVAQRMGRGNRCLAARSGGRLVGVMWVCTGRALIEYLDRELPLAAGDVYLFDAYTDPASRGQAIAPALSAELLRRFQEAGCQRAVRATLPENVAALRAHAKAGFQPYAVIGRVKLGGWRRDFLRLLQIVAAVVLAAAQAGGDELRWGIAGGLQFAIPPAINGPRGLVRLLYPTLPDGGYDLINFIAIEPIVRGRRGYSELEHSQADNAQGKRLWAEPSDGRLRATIRVEKFANGAHVRLQVTQRRDQPDEITFTIYAEPDSAPIEYCILSSTMSNKARNRHLWLKDEVVTSQSLFGDYRKNGFTRHAEYHLSRLPRTPQGDVLVAVTTDEKDPAATHPFPGSRHWYYGGFPVTQYWKKAKETVHEDLEVAVNARYTYWKSNRPIPGGVAFENFELRERFYDGQQFTFGITRRTGMPP